MPGVEINGTQVQKNNRGTLGPICNYCGGYGFTNMLSDKGGSSVGCPRCFGTGIEPLNINDLAKTVNQLARAVAEQQAELMGLKQIIISEAKRRI